MVRWCGVIFQCRGVLLIWITVGQGPTALTVGAGGGCLDIFTLIYPFSPLSGVVGWCDGAGLTSSAGASYNLDDSRARAYCACNRYGWGLFGHFYSHLSFLSSFSLSLGDGPI